MKDKQPDSERYMEACIFWHGLMRLYMTCSLPPKLKKQLLKLTEEAYTYCTWIRSYQDGQHEKKKTNAPKAKRSKKSKKSNPASGR